MDKVRLDGSICIIVQRLLIHVLASRWQPTSWSASRAATPISYKSVKQNPLTAAHKELSC